MSSIRAKTLDDLEALRENCRCDFVETLQSRTIIRPSFSQIGTLISRKLPELPEENFLWKLKTRILNSQLSLTYFTYDGNGDIPICLGSGGATDPGSKFFSKSDIQCLVDLSSWRQTENVASRN